MPRRRIACSLPLLLLAGCGARSGREPAIGEGFVAPATLNLRQELGPGQQAVGTVKHGERVEVLKRQRVFVKVRTPAGVEGWTDGRLLFTTEQMEDLRRLAEQATRLPSQGTASVYGKLNLHTEPNRQSASFHQLNEGDHVAVVAHRLSPKIPPPAGAAPQADAQGPADDWSLVRTRDGKAGWALFRMLTMSIPDEVAQYAEGHRITSYFSLGEVRDEDKARPTWLWTTIAKGEEPYEFDSFRIFVWSLRHHRYETAYIERNLKGYYPVEVRPAEAERGGSPSATSSFSVIVRDKDGSTWQRTYAFQGFRVRLSGKQPYNLSEPVFSRPTGASPQSPAPKGESWLGGLKRRISEIWHRRR